MAHMKFFALMALCIASASAQIPGLSGLPGMGGGIPGMSGGIPGMSGGIPGLGNIADIFKMTTDIVGQAVQQSMNMWKSAVDLVPIKEAMAMSEAALTSVANYPDKMMEIFSQAANTATQAAGGVANPGAEIFNMAAQRVGQLKEADAPKKDYMDMMQKLKAAMMASQG